MYSESVSGTVIGSFLCYPETVSSNKTWNIARGGTLFGSFSGDGLVDYYYYLQM